MSGYCNHTFNEREARNHELRCTKCHRSEAETLRERITERDRQIEQQGKMIVAKDKRITELEKDALRLDWMENKMRPDSAYCEIYLAGLRNFTGNATAFQIESSQNSPAIFSTFNAPTLREAIDAAISGGNNMVKNVEHHQNSSECDCKSVPVRDGIANDGCA